MMISEGAGPAAENRQGPHGAGPLPFEQQGWANHGLWKSPYSSLEDARDALSEAVAEAAGVRRGDRILEVGCGYGASAVCYTNRFNPAAVVGLDVTEGRIEKARKYVAKNGLSNRIRLEVGDATSLGFPAGSFNRVIAIECALHFDKRYDFFREASRVLSVGGGLGLADIVLRRGSDREEFIQNVHLPIGSDGSLDVPENVYDADVYADMLKKCGYDDIRIEDITGRTVEPMADYLEQVGNEAKGKRGRRCLRAAQIYRDYIKWGLEYVLVSARRAEV